MIRNLFLSLLLGASALVANSAYAIIDPCNDQVKNLSKSERLLNSAQRGYERTYDQLLRTQDQVAYQMAALDAAVGSAQATRTNANYTAGGNIGGCIIRSIFGGSRCIGGAIAGGISRVGNGQAAVDRAISRRDAFAKAGAGKIKRAQERLAYAERQYETSAYVYDVAFNQLDECRTNPAFVSTTTTISGTPGTGSTVTSVIQTGQGGGITSVGTVN